MYIHTVYPVYMSLAYVCIEYILASYPYILVLCKTHDFLDFFSLQA